ncbi:MAG: autophagy protein 17 [Peltula sp. TS41687]|nr:MAG: autophagy protein 17 [Peltula sp. TS41687]
MSDSPYSHTQEGGLYGSSESLEGRDEQDPSTTTTTTLEKLLDYLLASKRSLSSTNHVWRANEIVNSAREALTEAVIIQARSDFLKQAIVEQLRVLTAVKNGVEQVARQGRDDFEATLRDLDEADARLQATLDLLKSTLVEAALSPPQEEQRTLHHFVDEEGVEKLKAGIRASIDLTQFIMVVDPPGQEAHQDLRQAVKEFEHDIQSIRKAVESKSAVYIDHNGSGAPLATIVPSLEGQAKEMAELLESLARHFDLCVTALKHTEGGGAVARDVTTDMPMDIHLSSDDQGNSIEPISDEEKQEMLEVLAKDAAELEDVVMEIRDRLAEMETRFDYLITRLEHLTTVHADDIAAFHQLEDVGTRLPRYAYHGRDFVGRWEEQKQQITERMDELESLRDFYDNFLMAYDSMIIEIGRRRDMQNKMEAVAKEAMVKIDQDVDAREAFRQDHGPYLPSDIWPGLTNTPLRFGIVPVETDAGNIPDIPRKVLEQATRRAHRRL